jgi:hypothetical protein
LYYVAGASQGRIDLGGQALQVTDFALGFTENAFVTDVNRDGFADLLIGRSNGSLEWWKNNKGGIADFVLEDESFLGLSATVLRQNIACNTGDLDGNGTVDLVYGDQSGRVSIVSNFLASEDASEAISQIVFNPISKDYEARNLGGRIWPAIVNLFSSTRPSIVVGNTLGGVTILRHQEGQNLPVEAAIELYPNPIIKKTIQGLTIKVDRPALLETFSILGQELSSQIHLFPNEDYLYDVAHLKAGMYILRFTVDKKTVSRRLIVTE